MLGTFRWFLAILVTLSHLWASLTPWSAVAAVFCFFMLSGYLMTNVLNRVYGFNPGGMGRYAINRFLRIYPTYWLALLFSIVVIMTLTQDAFRLNWKLVIPDSFSSWLPNILIMGLRDKPLQILVPPAWTLDIELFFYLLMGLGLSRSRRIVVTWFLGSALYTAWMLLNDAPFAERYSTYAAASLPFSLGAMTYMYREALQRYLCFPVPVTTLAFLVILVGVRFEWLGSPFGFGFYLILCSAFLLLISLNSVDTASVSTLWRNIDKKLGDLAYPVFLCHQPAAVLVIGLFFDSKRPDGATLWLVSTVVVHLIAVLMYYLLDNNVNKLRDKIRGKKASFLQKI